MKKEGIYKITNPKGEIYIGQSTNIEARWENYRKLRCRDQRLLFKSLAKYGWLNHTFEIIEECQDLNNREQYWIKFYNSLDEGLNGMGVYTRKKSNWVFPESAKLIKSKKMKKHWAEGTIKRKWSKPIKDNKTGVVYGNIKEVLIAFDKNPTSYNWVYKNVGVDKKFSYI